jgi:hypothetical protein
VRYFFTFSTNQLFNYFFTNRGKKIMNATVTKQPKDVDSVTQTRFLMIALRLAPACVLLGWAIGGLSGLLFALPGSIVAALAVELLSGRLGDGSVNILYGMGRANGTFRDQFIGTLNQARFHKMSKRHDLALECVDEVLAADTDFPEALFLKAQILWEGYQHTAAAKQCLFHLMKVEPDKEASFHRWAVSLYKEIAGYERSQNELFPK